MAKVSPRADATGLAIALAFRLLVCAVVMASGFEAVSDDDFARVVHALDWAANPRFDASGTSWLPLPFWLYGLGFSVVGGSWLAAKSLADVGAFVSSGLLYLAARWFGAAPRGATLSVICASVLSWSRILGNAPVPELFAAACALVAVASLKIGDEHPPSVRRLTIGGSLLLAATLCRYEPWLVVPWFVFFALRRSSAPLPQRATVAFVPVVGPVVWMIANAVGHGGDPLHFLSRVTAYRKAFTPQGAPSLAFDYLRIVVFQEPELWLLLLGGLVLARIYKVKLPLPRGRLLVAGFVLLMLSAAAFRGGAATHHEGRALLFCWLAVALWSGEIIVGLTSTDRPRLRWWVGAWLVISATVGPLVLRPWYARRDGWAQRQPELELGRALQTALPPQSRVLFDSPDYGHFAVMVGLADPSRIEVLPRTAHPNRSPSTTDLLAAWRASSTSYLLTKRQLDLAGSPLGSGYFLYPKPAR